MQKESTFSAETKSWQNGQPKKFMSAIFAIFTANLSIAWDKTVNILSFEAQ
jgi:hypothetical protein